MYYRFYDNKLKVGVVGAGIQGFAMLCFYKKRLPSNSF